MKNTNKTLLTSLGFIFFLVGFSAICLMLMGIQYSFLTWIDAPGRLFGFVARLVIVIIGFLLVAFARMDRGDE